MCIYIYKYIYCIYNILMSHVPPIYPNIKLHLQKTMVDVKKLHIRHR